MNIHGFGNIPVKDSVSGSAARESSKAGNAAPTQTNPAAAQQPQIRSGESVSLSSEARLLQQLESKLVDLPEVDADRIAELKAQIDSGAYQVDSRAVAGKLLSFE